jgi:hypothetical protein
MSRVIDLRSVLPATIRAEQEGNHQKHSNDHMPGRDPENMVESSREETD